MCVTVCLVLIVVGVDMMHGRPCDLMQGCEGCVPVGRAEEAGGYREVGGEQCRVALEYGWCIAVLWCWAAGLDEQLCLEK